MFHNNITPLTHSYHIRGKTFTHLSHFIVKTSHSFAFFPATLKTMNNTTSEMYRIVALHESINVNSNVFNDIAEAILSRDTLKFHRRVARHLLAMKQRMKTMFSSRPTSFLSSLSSSDDGDIVCIDLDASLNHEENVFKDIVEAVLQRHLTEMKRHEIERDQQKPEHEIHDGTSKNIETKRSRRGFLGRVKDMMTCCTYCIQRA